MLAVGAYPPNLTVVLSAPAPEYFSLPLRPPPKSIAPSTFAPLPCRPATQTFPSSVRGIRSHLAVPSVKRLFFRVHDRRCESTDHLSRSVRFHPSSSHRRSPRCCLGLPPSSLMSRRLEYSACLQPQPRQENWCHTVHLWGSHTTDT